MIADLAFIHLLVVFSFSNNTDGGTGAGDRRNQSNGIDNDWKEWSYYQILGLAPVDYYYSQEEKNSSSSTSPSSMSLSIYKLSSRWMRRKERSTITKKEIKKAYCKQAQMWHPDKIMNARKWEHNDGDGDGDAYDKRSKKMATDIVQMLVTEVKSITRKTLQLKNAMQDLPKLQRHVRC